MYPGMNFFGLNWLGQRNQSKLPINYLKYFRLLRRRTVYFRMEGE
jgi:uncharacterized membrane protein YfbV (UPF0208 family)